MSDAAPLQTVMQIENSFDVAPPGGVLVDDSEPCSSPASSQAVNLVTPRMSTDINNMKFMFCLDYRDMFDAQHPDRFYDPSSQMKIRFSTFSKLIPRIARSLGLDKTRLLDLDFMSVIKERLHYSSTKYKSFMEDLKDQIKLSKESRPTLFFFGLMASEKQNDVSTDCLPRNDDYMLLFEVDRNNHKVYVYDIEAYRIGLSMTASKRKQLLDRFVQESFMEHDAIKGFIANSYTFHSVAMAPFQTQGANISFWWVLAMLRSRVLQLSTLDVSNPDAPVLARSPNDPQNRSADQLCPGFHLGQMESCRNFTRFWLLSEALIKHRGGCVDSIWVQQQLVLHPKSFNAPTPEDLLKIVTPVPDIVYHHVVPAPLQSTEEDTVAVAETISSPVVEPQLSVTPRTRQREREQQKLREYELIHQRRGTRRNPALVEPAEEQPAKKKGRKEAEKHVNARIDEESPEQHSAKDVEEPEKEARHEESHSDADCNSEKKGTESQPQAKEPAEDVLRQDHVDESDKHSKKRIKKTAKSERDIDIMTLPGKKSSKRGNKDVESQAIANQEKQDKQQVEDEQTECKAAKRSKHVNDQTHSGEEETSMDKHSSKKSKKEVKHVEIMKLPAKKDSKKLGNMEGESEPASEEEKDQPSKRQETVQEDQPVKQTSTGWVFVGVEHILKVMNKLNQVYHCKWELPSDCQLRPVSNPDSIPVGMGRVWLVPLTTTIDKVVIYWAVVRCSADNNWTLHFPLRRRKSGKTYGYLTYLAEEEESTKGIVIAERGDFDEEEIFDDVPKENRPEVTLKLCLDYLSKIVTPTDE